jgi:hypothetical protein
VIVKLRKNDRLDELGTIQEEAKDVLPDVVNMIKAREKQELDSVKQREEFPKNTDSKADGCSSRLY